MVLLGSGHATCLRFNRKGDLLASGRVDGTVVIFDIETNGVARKLRGHTRQMQSLRYDFRFPVGVGMLMREKLVSGRTVSPELIAGLEMHFVGLKRWLKTSHGQV